MILFVLFFFVFLLILHGLPMSLDDYLFHYKYFESVDEALQYLLEFGNGRFFGNGGSLILLHHPVLGDLVRAAVLAGITILLPIVLSLHSRYMLMLSMLLFLTISPGVFGQAYSWMSGFQNYVPPLLLLLLVLLMIRKTGNGNPTANAFFYILIFIISLCMQFYIEHSSCLNVLTAFLMVLWTRKKPCFTASVIFLTGTLIGLVCMFSAMLFLAPRIWGGVQSYLSGGIFSTIRGLVRNAVLLLGMYSENAVALCMLAIFCSILVARYPETFSGRTRPALYLGMLVPSAIFFLCLISSIKPYYGKLAVAESILLVAAMLSYMFSILFALIRLARHTGRQNIIRAAVLFAMALIAILPILAVWPTGYRCLFHSFVMLAGAILLLAEELTGELTGSRKKHAVSAGAAAALAAAVFCLTAVFCDIRRMVSIRDAWLEEQAYLGEEAAAYFLIPSPYLYENWNEENEHYRTIDGHQMRLKILPADVWFRMYYYHYT